MNIMKERKKTILVFGLLGSGKTTFAKKLTKNTTIPHFNYNPIIKEIKYSQSLWEWQQGKIF